MTLRNGRGRWWGQSGAWAWTDWGEYPGPYHEGNGISRQRNIWMSWWRGARRAGSRAGTRTLWIGWSLWWATNECWLACTAQCRERNSPTTWEAQRNYQTESEEGRGKGIKWRKEDRMKNERGKKGKTQIIYYLPPSLIILTYTCTVVAYISFKEQFICWIILHCYSEDSKHQLYQLKNVSLLN